MGYIVTQPTLLKGHKEQETRTVSATCFTLKFWHYYYFYDNCYFCERARTEFQGMAPNHVFLHEVGYARDQGYQFPSHTPKGQRQTQVLSRRHSHSLVGDGG